MGLLFRRRRPLMRLAAGATAGGVAYQAGQRDAQGAPHTPEPAPAPDPAGSRPAVRTTDLERLARLHQSGALTDDEFTVAKSRLLGM